MNRIGILVFLLSIVFTSSAQDYKFGFGFLDEFRLSGGTANSFGLQAMYNLDKHSSVQAQVFGRKNYVGIGADYLFSVLDKKKKNYNVFLGLGIEENIFWSTEDDAILQTESKSNYFNGNGQIGVSYYFKPVQLSVYSSYKVKYEFKNEDLRANFITIGVRYHLW